MGMQTKKRIVITGLGTLNAIANNIPDFVTALRAGVCGIRPVDLFETAGFRCHNGGQIHNFAATRLHSARFSPQKNVPGGHAFLCRNSGGAC